MKKALVGSHGYARCFAVSCLLLASWPGVPLQAFQARILLVRAPGVPARVAASAGSALAEVGELIDVRQYLGAAADAHLAPHSSDALAQIAPTMHARLIVVLSTGVPEKLAVSYRDGYSGRVLQDLSLPMHRQALAAAALRTLASQAAAAIAVQEHGQPDTAEAIQPAETERVPEELEALSEAAPAEFIVPEPARARRFKPAPEVSKVANAEPSLQSTSAQEQTTPRAASADRLVVRAGCGMGFGERAVHVPSQSGDQYLDTTLFPALDLFMRGDAALGRHAVLGLHLHYQTSVGLVGTEPTTAKTSFRSHRIDMGFAPGLRFVQSDNAVTLGLFAGWGFRGLRSVVEVNVPAYMLHGAVTRLELRIPVADGLLVLRLAPEIFLVAFASGALRQVSGSAAAGIAWGGEASLDVRLSKIIYVALAYRESRAKLASVWGTDVTDVERFATLSAVLRY